MQGALRPLYRTSHQRDGMQARGAKEMAQPCALRLHLICLACRLGFMPDQQDEEQVLQESKEHCACSTAHAISLVAAL